jgi:hypothetical protein
MSTSRQRRRKANRAAAIIAALAALAVLPALAFAHGSYQARAVQPAFDSGELRLVGSGGYGTERPHSQIRVTVCLRKRYGQRFFAVRCMTDYDDDRRVRAQVSVPGCVDGVWRTTAQGEALGRRGNWTHAEFDASRPFRCAT